MACAGQRSYQELHVRLRSEIFHAMVWVFRRTDLRAWDWKICMSNGQIPCGRGRDVDGFEAVELTEEGGCGGVEQCAKYCADSSSPIFFSRIVCIKSSQTQAKILSRNSQGDLKSIAQRLMIIARLNVTKSTSAKMMTRKVKSKADRKPQASLGCSQQDVLFPKLDFIFFCFYTSSIFVPLSIRLCYIELGSISS